MHRAGIAMCDPEKTEILVVAYDDNARATLAASLEPFGAHPVPCSTFCEAEAFARTGPYRGVLVDLATMIKAKAEEKIVAYTLTGFYPTLRVKTMGRMLVPMAMAGDAKQDKSLNDFLAKSCAEFTPRPLRAFRRKDVCVPTSIGDARGFTLNISWSGVFVVDMDPERFSVGEDMTVTFPECGLDVQVVVARIQGWGEHRPPGIGLKFGLMCRELENYLQSLLKSDKENDRDRLVS